MPGSWKASRRDLLVGAGVSVVWFSPAAAAQDAIFVMTEIASGKGQGRVDGPILEFRGIPYGAPTGGRNRYMPPQAPAKWTGVRDCFAGGDAAPQEMSDFRSDYFAITQWDRKLGGGMSEDCLSLDVWTPSVDRSAKKAVLVSFHGGRFSGGSGNAQLYEGKFLALFGDVVVVTVNHRLSSFGYLNLEGLGAPDRFKYAGVAGMLDLVAALRWVRENIESFGGDPSRVMIFGDSGGGSKTSVMMGMPGAAGLFHRAAVQSGSLLRLQSQAAATAIARDTLNHLGIAASNISDIQKLSWKQILAAQSVVGSKRFGPVVGTDAIPEHPFDPTASKYSANVPLIVSTCLEDMGIGAPDYDLDEAGLLSHLEQRFPKRGAEILALYRRRSPGARPFFIQAQAVTDATSRPVAETQALRKAALPGGAPAWMYEWDWRTPAYGGEFGAVHGGDIPASFHSYRDAFFAGGASGKLMADRLASAWVAFAKTGDPNCPILPHWPAFEPVHRATMIFDDDTRVEDDPRGEIRAYWEAHPASAAVAG